MLRVKRLVCLLSIIFLFDTYDISIITPFNALATDVVKDKNIELIHQDKMELYETPIEMQYEKITQKELIKENEKKNEPQWKEFILTFYTSLESENSSAGPVTCQNKPLARGGVANNVIPQNTKIYLDGYGQVTVNDKGSDEYFGVDNRLDVFIEREPGESDIQYSERVKSYGVLKVRGYIVK
jgi:3D (Asp-Asp-Asp) domain-containing protein